DFDGLRVGQHAFFRGAVFNGPVNFSVMQVKGDFEISTIAKEGKKTESIFRGSAKFGGADIGRLFSADGARFEGQDQKANFNGMKVGTSAWLEGAVFQGLVDFGSADIGRNFNADGVRFENKDQEADFNSLRVGQHAFFRGAVFNGPVDFSVMQVKGDFEISTIEKEGKKTETVFRGSADFGGADIGGQFNAEGARFENKDQEANFATLKVGQGALFSRVNFAGPVNLRFGTIQVLNLGGVIWPTQPDAIDLEGLTYKVITAGDESNSCQKLLALLGKARFHSQPYTQLETFLKQSGYPELANESFISRKRRELNESWSWGEPSQWPRVFLEKTLLDRGVGYGRNPERALYWSAFFILLGTIIFSRPGVLTRAEKGSVGKIRLTQAFWFSLDAYVPFISFGPDKLYQVKPDKLIPFMQFIPSKLTQSLPERLHSRLTGGKFSVQTYFYLHQIAGYVLVTIGVAAVTGIIK
ncbi:MAG: hypothetical protein WBV23_14275, partial [Desulfobaccales bacterium]